MRTGSGIRIAAVAATMLALTAGSALAQLLEATSSAVTTPDGHSIERRGQIENEWRDTLLGNAINFPGMVVADAWGPVTDLGQEFRRPVTSAVATLILVGDLDPRTPIANAREIAGTLLAAKVVVMENATHQFDVFGSNAIRAILAQFLRGEQVATDTLALPAIRFQ